MEDNTNPATRYLFHTPLGNGAVGKSSCVERFVKGEFYEFQQSTIGAAFLTQTVQVQDYTVKFEIWDTAGQERYRSLAPMYYRGAAAALVVYDITEYESFNGAKAWIEELQRQGSTDIVIALAGNKVDCESRREVSTQAAKEYAQETGCLFFETSAKTGQNIDAVFQAIAEKLPKNTNAQPDVIKDNIIQFLPPEEKKSCCK